MLTVQLQTVSVIIYIFRLLFHNSQNPARIFKSKLDGSDLMAIVSSDLAVTYGMSLDYLNKRLYWAHHSKFIFLYSCSLYECKLIVEYES